VSVAAGADVPAALQRELAGVCKACFSQDSGGRQSRSAVQREVRAPAPAHAPARLPACRRLPAGPGRAGCRSPAAGPLSAPLSSGLAPEGGARACLLAQVREAFVADLNPEGDTFPRTLGELSERLKVRRRHACLWGG
jgi:transformation/transcription domain-associated protein